MVLLSKDYLIIGAYDSEPKLTSQITYYYEEISKSLYRFEDISKITKIGEYRDISVLLVSKKHKVALNSSHIPLEDEVRGYNESSTPKLLKEMVDYSLNKIGFFPKTTIRLFEYPWIYEQIEKYKRLNGTRIVDVGAGVSLLPFYLADKEAIVTTIDPHPNLERKLEDKHNWNEWGFFKLCYHGSKNSFFEKGCW
jgi:hypothetical protein